MADGYLVFTTDDFDTDSSVTSQKEVKEPVGKKESTPSRDLRSPKIRTGKGLSISSVVPKSPGVRPTLSRNISQETIGSHFSMPRQVSNSPSG